MIAAAVAAASLAAAPPLPRVTLQAGSHTFEVEVASTPAQRQQGLMGRTRLDEGSGMLFVFEEADRHCFWMKDTPIPLSIAFLDDDGTIVDIADMQPKTLDHHCPAEQVRYALEVEQGGFLDRGIQAGARITGGPFGAR